MSKFEADSLKKISSTKLREWGCLTSPPNGIETQGSISWKRTFMGESHPDSSVGYIINHEDGKPCSMKLSYTLTANNKDIEYSVGLVSRPCNYGGERWYLLCPSSQCIRKCTKLYLLNGYFLCRTCHKLTYESNNTSPLEKQLHAAFKYNSGFPSEAHSFIRLMNHSRRYPYFKGKPTHATRRVLDIVAKRPSPEKQELILYRSFGMPR